MYKPTFLASTVLVCAGCLCQGGSAVIGVAMIYGTARVDHAAIRGNATILDGSIVETEKGMSQLSLQGGARIELSAASRGTVYRDHVVLEKGLGQLHAAGQFPVLVKNLRVLPVGSDATLRVAIKDDRRVLVAVVSGAGKVLNSKGLLLATLTPGTTLEFDQDAGAAAQAKLIGRVEMRGGKYFITDRTTHVVSELVGDNLESYVGKQVEISGAIDAGATPAAGATQVVHVAVAGVKVIGAVAGGASGAGGAAAAGGFGGLSAVATTAIIGGVAVAGTLGGLAASGTFSSSQSSGQ